MKVCRKCNIGKELFDFHKRENSKDGHENQCKECRKKYQEKNAERIKAYREQRYLEIKDTDEFKEKRKQQHQKNKEYRSLKSKEYRTKNKEKLSENKKIYYKNNKEKILQQRKEKYLEIKSDDELLNKKREKDRKNTRIWREENKEEISQKIKDRKKNDPVYKLIDSIRTLIWNSIKRMGINKNSKTQEILGCTFEEFKTYIESQFQEGMSWENHGQWHLDHKIPISWAESEEKVYELNHWKNFQPLWAKDNLTKSNKWSD